MGDTTNYPYILCDYEIELEWKTPRKEKKKRDENGVAVVGANIQLPKRRPAEWNRMRRGRGNLRARPTPQFSRETGMKTHGDIRVNFVDKSELRSCQ